MATQTLKKQLRYIEKQGYGTDGTKIIDPYTGKYVSSKGKWGEKNIPRVYDLVKQYLKESKQQAKEAERQQALEAERQKAIRAIEATRKRAEAKKAAKRRRAPPAEDTRPKVSRTETLDLYNNFKREIFHLKNVKTLEQYYELINAQRPILGNMTYIAIQFLCDENKVRTEPIRRMVGNAYLFSYEEFLERIAEIRQGNQQGSDPIDDECELDLSRFIAYTYSITGHGSSELMLFHTVGIESKELCCLGECLEKCGYRGIAEIAKKSRFTYLKELMDIIKKYNLKINVLSNGFTLKKSLYDTFQGREIINISYTQKKKDKKEKVILLDEDDVKYHYLYQVNEPEHTIIYDEYHKHYDVIEGRVRLKPNIHLSSAGEVWLDDKLVFTARGLNTNTKNRVCAVKFEYVFFDCETVIDFGASSCMKAYSLSILHLTKDDLEWLERVDSEKDEVCVAEIREKHCITFTGYDCFNQFMDWIIINQRNTAFCFVGFNNASFDNFLFLENALLYRDDNYSVSDIFYNGSQLLNFRINGRHDTFDIHKHLVGSLASNCKSFKINCCAKKSFDHTISQRHHDNGSLIEFINNNQELKEYNEFDVLATAVLFQKYKKSLKSISPTAPYADDIHTIKTVGSLIYKVFVQHTTKLGVELPQLSLQQYQDLQKYKVAGRVEMFNGVQKIEERMASPDVCSLYPYVMAVNNVYYPCGVIEEVERFDKNRLGFYYCDIDQSNLRAKNLPLIYPVKAKNENDWGHSQVLENYLISSQMIELLRLHKCKVTIHKGFVFTKKIKSCQLFGFLLEFMKEKNRQDTLKQNNDPEYNSALRETIKLLCNSLSGKVIEGLHTEKTTAFENVYEFSKIQNKATSINFINVVGNKLFATYEVSEADVIKKQRPIYLGVSIYDYAKIYMYQASYARIGLKDLVYTDTDATKVRYSSFLKWRQWVDTKNVQVPHWQEVEQYDPRYRNHKLYDPQSKVFGSFEDELDELQGSKYAFYCLQKKSWMYKVDSKSKFRFKGVNERAILLDAHTDPPTVEQSSEEKARADYTLCETDKKNSLKYRAPEFFERLYTNGTARVMCVSFRKIIKNSLRSVGLEESARHNNMMNKIKVCYMVKEVRI